MSRAIWKSHGLSRLVEEFANARIAVEERRFSAAYSYKINKAFAPEAWFTSR